MRISEKKEVNTSIHKRKYYNGYPLGVREECTTIYISASVTVCKGENLLHNYQKKGYK